MRFSGHHHIDGQMEYLVFDSTSAEVQPDEEVPLLKHLSVPLSGQKFELAPVHMSNHEMCASGVFRINSKVKPAAELDAKCSYFETPNRGIFCIFIIVLQVFGSLLPSSSR